MARVYVTGTDGIAQDLRQFLREDPDLSLTATAFIATFRVEIARDDADAVVLHTGTRVSTLEETAFRMLLPLVAHVRGSHNTGEPAEHSLVVSAPGTLTPTGERAVAQGIYRALLIAARVGRRDHWWTFGSRAKG